MVVKQFPPVELADENGILAVGGDLEVESLLLAYRNGIFPWPVAGFDPLVWFSPPERALLFTDEMRVNRSLLRALRTTEFKFSMNRVFGSVIANCAKARADKLGTWITDEMLHAYIDLHEAGYAYSIECFNGTKLVGGLYGVAIGKMISGESMFYTQSNASKLCLMLLIKFLNEIGVDCFDCQVMTPHLAGFGAREIAREDFIPMLETAATQDCSRFNALAFEEFASATLSSARSVP